MEQTNQSASDAMSRYLRVYQIEPLGRLLSDRLKLPLLVVWLLFVFLYFGVLLILHTAVGTPAPANIEDVFRNPSTTFYYPNLIGVTYDFVGNPFQLALLIFLRSHIPHQFVQLQRSGFIKEKQPTSRMSRFLRAVGTDARIQTSAMILYPLVAMVVGTVVAALAFLPKGLPPQYALFLTALSIYVRAAVFVQLIYMFVILGNYQFDFRLQLKHPDGCSGIAPFGRLAMAPYFYMFIVALIIAFGTLAGGTPFEIVFGNTSVAGAFVYLWLFFPLVVILIFAYFIYGPHRALKELQRQHLLTSSVAWTAYHQQLLSSISETAKRSTAPLASKSEYHYGDDLELLEVWAKLNNFVEDMHTWPIPRRAFRAIVVFVNPLIPILLPVVFEVVRNLLL